MQTLLRLAALCLALALTALPGSAADYADRAIIGFSPDGGVFAFEEYGVQDGSGFPYSYIYVIDTDRDAWLEGSPVRVVIESEEAGLAEARTAARKQAAPLLGKYKVGAEGTVLASNPETEIADDPHVVRFFSNPYLRHDDRKWALTLTDLPFPDAPPCENLGPVSGFRLVLANAQGSAITLNEDKSLPASRGCAQAYAISDVILYRPSGAEPVLAVILRVYTQGFEGSDGRHLAVTRRLDGTLPFQD